MAELDVDRRRFIAGALSVPAIALAAGCGAGERAGPVARRTHGGRIRSWREVRAMFDLDPGVAHLSAYILAPHSRAVRDAIARHRRGLDRDPRSYLLDNEALENEAAEAAARHLQTSAGLVALTDSATMGLGLVFGGLRLREGDELVVSVHDHFVARSSAQYAADRTGARVRQLELFPPRAPEQATVRGIVSAYEQAIGPSTRVVLMTWVQSSSGLRIPLREIADVVDRANRGRSDEERALLVVDAAHALGGGPAPVEELGCDFLVSGCHKWLLGPRGTGIIWGSERAWGRVAPLIPSFRGGGSDDPPGALMTPGGYHSFEHRWALAEAFDLHARVGADRIAARIAHLSDELRDGLSSIRRVRVHTPHEASMRSGIVAFSVDGRDGPATVRRLFGRDVHASVGPYDVQLARLGTCWLNTEEEVEAAIRGVRGVA